MDYICFVKRENARKAEDALRKDFDVAARQSITIRDAAALGISTGTDGSFFQISGSDEGVARCKELLKEFIFSVDAKILEQANKKIQEEADAAASGVGGIFG